MKRAGLQWSFRLLQEPKRLGARYLVCHTRFVWAAARELAHGIRRNRRIKGPEVTPQLSQIPPVTAARPAAGAVDLSVVIVTHNSASLLGPCLESLLAECSGLIAQILVVDTASSDDTCGFVRTHFPQVHLIPCSQNLGFPAANNLALPHCRGRYIALLNPDTIVRAGAIRRLMSHLDENSRAGAAGPKLRLADGTVQPECARPLPQLTNLLPWLLLLDKLQWRLRYRNAYRKVKINPPQGTWLDSFNLLFWERDRSCEVGYICGACMLIRRQVVQEIGLLDEASPMYLDDMDYCRRIANAGWTIHYVSEAEITHLWQQSSRPLSREADFYVLVCHSMWLYFRKHEGRLAGSLFAFMVGAAGLFRTACIGLALPVARGSARQACRRQLLMAGGLCRWALRIQKRPPRLGFACESQPTDSPTVAITQ